MELSFLLSDDALALLICASLLMLAGMVVHFIHSRHPSQGVRGEISLHPTSPANLSAESPATVRDQKIRAA